MLILKHYPENKKNFIGDYIKDSHYITKNTKLSYTNFSYYISTVDHIIKRIYMNIAKDLERDLLNVRN